MKVKQKVEYAYKNKMNFIFGKIDPVKNASIGGNIYVSNASKIRQRKSKPTPCSTFKELQLHLEKNQGNDPEFNIIQLCKLRIDQKTKKEDIYKSIHRLLQRKPQLIHSIESHTGYNILHLICSNPALVSYLKLIKLIVNTADQEQERESILGINNGRFTKVKPKQLDNSPASAKILRQKSNVDSELALHLVCRNATSSTLDVIEFLVQSHPASVCIADSRKQNLPLHNICISCTITEISLEIVLLLVQRWPESCKVQNGDGNLPLHLAAKLTTLPSPRLQSIHQSLFDKMEVDTLEDLSFDDLDCDAETATEEDYSDEFLGSIYMSQSSINYMPPAISDQIRIHEIYDTFKNEREEFERNELARYQKQLDIIQYLVHLYPAAIHIRNNKGLTPFQLAIGETTSSNKAGQIDKFDRFKAVNEKRKGDREIVEFLRDLTMPTTATVIPGSESSSQNQYSLVVHVVDNNIDNHMSSFIDTSGNEFENGPEGDNPWRCDESIEKECNTSGNQLNHSFTRTSSFRTNSQHSSIGSMVDRHGYVDPMLAIQALDDASEVNFDNACKQHIFDVLEEDCNDAIVCNSNVSTVRREKSPGNIQVTDLQKSTNRSKSFGEKIEKWRTLDNQIIPKNMLGEC